MLRRLGHGSMQKTVEDTEPDEVRPGFRAIGRDGGCTVPMDKFYSDEVESQLNRFTMQKELHAKILCVSGMFSQTMS